ncbi:MAG: Sec-independent protein translocase subunit TatA/TatB [Solirubrobacteraceae bacterium]
MPNIGPMELIIILVIVLLVFGPKRLPGLGRQLGSGMREFKDSITGKDDERGAGRGGLAAAPETPEAPKQAPASPHPETVTGEARPQDQPVSRAD